jgi:long-chain acyl-CoA synthetase
MVTADITRIFDILDYQISNYPLEDALARREDKKNWTRYSSIQFRQQSDKVSMGLLKLGLKPGDKVAIISTTNRPEWHFIDRGCLQVGVVDVPIYPTISPSEYEYILNHAEVEYIFLSDRLLYKKINQIAEKVPSLKAIYSFDHIDGVPSWKEMTAEGDELKEKLNQLKASIQPSDLATIIYTSGTTGFPKGVMLSHNNIVSNVKASLKMVPVQAGEIALSFLPICHVFERVLNYTYMLAGASIYYADGLETITTNLADVRPHYFATVPRLLEKVYEAIMKKGKTLRGLKAKLFFWAVDLSSKLPIDEKLTFEQKLQLKVADVLIFSKWRAALGGRVKAIICGSAPLQPRLATIFNNAGIPVLEGYGLTETSPVLSVNPMEKGKIKAGSVGKILPGVQIKIAEDGEILVKGPNVMMGYYKDEVETAKAFTEDGWLKTGDIGEFVDGDYLKITDRKKELFKTSGGKYVAPSPIENKLKESFLIEQVALVGDGRKFVSALIVPNFENLNTWCLENAIPYSEPETMVLDEKVKKMYQGVVNEFNVEFGKVEQVKKIALMPREWTVETGELTPTMKLRRKVIADKYRKIIDGFYEQQ